jgi:hypothetical protein
MSFRRSRIPVKTPAFLGRGFFFGNMGRGQPNTGGRVFNVPWRLAVSFGLDPLANIVALAALFIAIREVRRNSSVVVRLGGCKSIATYGQTPLGLKETNRLDLVIRNEGITLHDPNMSLTFLDEKGYGRITIPIMRRDEITGGQREFSRGMIATFSLVSDEIEPAWRDVILGLKDCRKSQATLCLYSQTFLVKTIRLGTRKDDLIRIWNGWAHRINRESEGTLDGQPIKRGKVLPTFRNNTDELRTFQFLLTWTVTV